MNVSRSEEPLVKCTLGRAVLGPSEGCRHGTVCAVCTSDLVISCNVLCLFLNSHVIVACARSVASLPACSNPCQWLSGNPAYAVWRWQHYGMTPRHVPKLFMKTCSRLLHGRDDELYMS
jgi:hypothetical protein